MTGGFGRPKKDKELKASGGVTVKAGEILARGLDIYKAGSNVKGTGTLYAACSGKVYFTRKKTPHGRFRTFIHVRPAT